MPLLKPDIYTTEYIYSLPEGQRAELIDGNIYDMAPPSLRHQNLIFSLARIIAEHIDTKNGTCSIILAPFAVFLDNDNKTYVEPDISVICDKSKLDEHGCHGAPDFIIEIVSPSSRRMDYNIKNGKYAEAGVREYWIVDPEKKRTTVYRYEEDAAPMLFTFDQTITVGIYKDLQITMSELIN